MDCDYTYVASSSEVTSQSLSSLDLSIGGTDLPTSDVTVYFGGAPCSSISSDGSSMTCTLDWAPYGGDHLVEVYDSNGMVSVSGSVTATTVSVTVTSSSIEENDLGGLNQNGGDTLTIVGTGFPNVASYIEVKMSDDTACVVTSSTPTEIVCVLDDLEKPVDTSTPLTFSLLDYTPSYGQRRRRRNLQQVFIDGSGNFIISVTNPECASVSPTSISPVINTNTLTFTLNDYTSTIVASDFSVSMVKSDDASITRTLNVIAVDDGAKTFTVKFPGAASGIYGFKVKGIRDRSISCPVTIETIMEVTNYSPT